MGVVCTQVKMTDSQTQPPTPLPVPVIGNYKRGWAVRTLALQDIDAALAGDAPTLSEHLAPDAIVKPYVDVDAKPAAGADFEAFDRETRERWDALLRPLCPDLAVCTRSDAAGGKVSYHYTLNGLKCRADRLAQYFAQLASEEGFDGNA